MGISYYEGGRYTYKSANDLKFTANGNVIQNGYKFKEPGKKTIVAKFGGKQTSYKIDVITNFSGNVKECRIINEPKKLSFRQSVDAFDASGIIVRAYYTDGRTEDFGESTLQFTAGGNPIKTGYKFTHPGEKDLVVKLNDYEVKYRMEVTPTFTKKVSRCEVISEPSAQSYTVGSPFHICEFTVRCYYADGSTEDFDGNRLNVTANGNTMYDGYRFTQSGNKKVLVRLGDFTQEYSLTVSK